MLLAVVGTAGRMTGRPAPTSTTGHIVSSVDPTIDPAEEATDQCAQFSCER